MLQRQRGSNYKKNRIYVHENPKGNSTGQLFFRKALIRDLNSLWLFETGTKLL